MGPTYMYVVCALEFYAGIHMHFLPNIMLVTNVSWVIPFVVLNVLGMKEIEIRMVSAPPHEWIA